MIAPPDLCAVSEAATGFPAPDRPRPLKLRGIAREAVRYLNQIGLQRTSLEFDWLDRRWSVQIAPLAAPVLAHAELARIDWGGADVSLRIGIALLEAAMSGALQVDHVGAVDGEVRAVLVEAAFSELAGLVEAQARKRFRLLETRAEPASTKVSEDDPHGGHRYGFSLILNDGEIDYVCEAWIDDLALGFLANALRDWPVQASRVERWSYLPVPIHLSAGWSTLSLAAIRRLAIHDVILLDECLVGGEEDLILIRFGGRFGIRGKLAGSTITVIDWLDEIMDETDEFDDFDDESAPLRADAEGADGGDLDRIPIRMSFDLGERLMTLSELRTLAPGYVIELGRDIRRAVTIRVNGRKIGEGELVDIDGYIGLSLLSIDPPSV